MQRPESDGMESCGQGDSEHRDKNWTLADLEAELLKGLASGPGEPVTSETWERIRRSVQRRSSTRGSER